MTRLNTAIACLLGALALTGCGRGNALSASVISGNTAQANSLFHSKAPHNRLLAPGELNADFDHGLATATAEAKVWDKTATLFWAAHRTIHPTRDGAKSLPHTFYAFNAGIDTLTEMLSPDTLLFKQQPHLLSRIFVGSVDPTKLIGGAQATEVAMGTGILKTADPNFVLIRLRTMKDAVYSFADDLAAAPVEGTQQTGQRKGVTVDAYTGNVVGDSKVLAEAADVMSQVSTQAATDATSSL